MTTAHQSLAISGASRLTQLAMAALLGIFIVGILGFTQMEAVHNAGHDYRHAMAFPCH